MTDYGRELEFGWFADPDARLARETVAAAQVADRAGLDLIGVQDHPYNPGHLMVLPYRHVAGLEELTEEESGELMAMTQQAIRVIRRVSSPHAFNVGINLGGAAGGSLADHLHQHLVPRWGGDANFITVVGGTKTLPQLLGDTRALLAEAWDAPAS